jgi:hypothetical protein
MPHPQLWASHNEATLGFVSIPENIVIDHASNNRKFKMPLGKKSDLFAIRLNGFLGCRKEVSGRGNGLAVGCFDGFLGANKQFFNLGDGVFVMVGDDVDQSGVPINPDILGWGLPNVLERYISVLSRSTAIGSVSSALT